ncbi:Crp/Fnr family transcriptional regulator [Fulvivirga sp.]|uniref:Crp/Fnr family transcriptional regulator n=1 Tax=Fulvivirga sp. TaxID=1931237 RepID=UPI0032EC3BCE
MNTVMISDLSIENELRVSYSKFKMPLHRLLELAEKLTFNRGHILFSNGNIARGMYVIDTGKVKLSKFGVDGKEQIIKILHQGDAIGHEALLNDQRFHEYAEVLEDSALFYIGRDDFESVCNKEISVLNYFTQLLCDDLNKVEERLVSTAYEPVRGRLASILLELIDIYKDDSSSGINLSRGDLANLVGTAKETSIRLLYEFKNEGLIDLNGQHIIIKDIDNLKRAACFYR